MVSKIFYGIFILMAVLFTVNTPNNLFFEGEALAAEISVTIKIGICGDDVIDGTEQCDNSDLGGQSCTNRGFDSGTLGCTVSCEYDTSSCTTDSPSPPPSGGGGGGGGGIIAPITAVVFKGKAYPSSDITLLKDAQVVAITKAGPDANFEIRLSGLSAGTYTFGVWGEDNKGNRSITYAFTASVTTGVTTLISGIFLPPTIIVDKKEVRKGDIIKILGQSVPSAEVAILINSETELLKKIIADVSGAWLYQLDTLEIEYGDHTAKARSTKNGDITTFSKTIRFKVGLKNVLADEPQKCATIADTNIDCKVNLIDFSILAFWYKKSTPLSIVDLNNDGVVNLVDFSIMAFYWTG